jgi:hypothetical protein
MDLTAGDGPRTRQSSKHVNKVDLLQCLGWYDRSCACSKSKVEHFMHTVKYTAAALQSDCVGVTNCGFVVTLLRDCCIAGITLTPDPVTINSNSKEVGDAGQWHKPNRQKQQVTQVDTHFLHVEGICSIQCALNYLQPRCQTPGLLHVLPTWGKPRLLRDSRVSTVKGKRLGNA